MCDRNLLASGMAVCSQGSNSQNLSNTMDETIPMPNDGDTVFSTYGYSESRNAQDVMGSAVPFLYDPTWMSTVAGTSTVGLTPQLQTLPTWFGNRASEPIVMQNVDALGQQNGNRTLTQDRSPNFLDQTVACIRAFNANSDPNDENISKLAEEAGLTITEMTCWFGLIPKIRQCAQTNASTSFAQVPLSPSESRSFASQDAGVLIGQPDDSRSSRRSHSQMQMQALTSPWTADPRSTQILSPIASRRRRLPSRNLTNTVSTSVSVSRKRPRLDVNEKLYPCLECGKSCPADGWYEHLVRVHFPECVWTCGCKENKDTDMQKLWPRWDNFLKHLVERHAFKRSPVADASIKSRSIEVIGCYHHICGFCESPLQSRQNSLDHIKDHLDNGLQFENWTHLCLSKHDLRSHIPADFNCYLGINNRVHRGSDDDKDDGNGYNSYETHRNQSYGSSNTSANAGSARDLIGYPGGFEGSQPHSHHQPNTINRADCEAPETPLSSDLDEILLPFKSLRGLGHGGYGIVDEVVSSSSNETYARKTIRSRQASHNTTSYISQLKNELRILQKLNHPHLIKLVGYYTTQTSIYIIMSPVADVNLADYIRQYIPTTSLQGNYLLKWMSCLASAVAYLHDEKIQHRDIKPQNVLVKGQDVFLTDLGNAKLLLDPEDVSAGIMIITPMYCAPETISEGFQDCKADIFSLGCVFTEMYSGYFRHSSQEFESTILDFDGRPYHVRVRETQRYLKNVEDLHNHALSPELTLLFTTICQMLEIEPTERPEAKSLQSSFPDSSRCRCCQSPSRPRSAILPENSGHLPTSESFDLEELSSSTRKSDTPEDLSKFPTLNDNSFKIVSTLQKFMKPTLASNNPHEMGHPGISKTSPLGSTSGNLLTEQAQLQADTSQYRSEQLHRPKLSEGESKSCNIKLHSLTQRQRQSVKPVFRNIQAKSTLSSPGLIEITESSVITKSPKNVTRIVGRRLDPLKAKIREDNYRIRNVGACAPCRIKKIRCSEGESCNHCLQKYSQHPLQRSRCLRGPLVQYIGVFFPAVLLEHLSQAAIKIWIDTNWIVNTKNEVTVQVSSGKFFKPMTLEVREICASNQDSLLLADLTSSNDHDQKIASIPTLQYALKESEVDQAKEKCLEYINFASNCQLDDPETLIGDTPEIVCKSLEYILRWKNSAARETDLIQKALKVYWIQYAMSQTFTFCNQSAIFAVARLPNSSTVHPSKLDMSAQVLNRQLKGALNVLFEECLGDLLRCLENTYRSKTRRSWVSCFCANLILGLITELLQNAIDGMVMYKISEKGEDPTSAIERGTKSCWQLEELPISYSWAMFFGLYKSYNPIKNGCPQDDNSGQNKGEVELINAFAHMIRDNEHDILKKAAEPCFGGTSRIIEHHKSFCARNSARHLSKFLKEFC